MQWWPGRENSGESGTLTLLVLSFRELGLGFTDLQLAGPEALSDAGIRKLEEHERYILQIACSRPYLPDIIAMKTIIFTRHSAKQLSALPDDARKQVEDALDAYAIGGDGDVKPLKGRDGFRLRTGDYRVIFDQDAATILAIYVGKREPTTYRR
jgi:mRNA interferase RelE/StbE